MLEKTRYTEIKRKDEICAREEYGQREKQREEKRDSGRGREIVKEKRSESEREEGTERLKMRECEIWERLYR